MKLVRKQNLASVRKASITFSLGRLSYVLMNRQSWIGKLAQLLSVLLECQHQSIYQFLCILWKYTQIILPSTLEFLKYIRTIWDARNCLNMISFSHNHDQQKANCLTIAGGSHDFPHGRFAFLGCGIGDTVTQQTTLSPGPVHSLSAFAFQCMTANAFLKH